MHAMKLYNVFRELNTFNIYTLAAKRIDQLNSLYLETFVFAILIPKKTYYTILSQ